MNRSPGDGSAAPRDNQGWLGPAVYMAVVSLYFVARYGGQWAEADSTTFARVIRAFVAEGRLVPERGEVYPNGYAFQGISTFIVALTGLDVGTLQQLIYPLTAALLALPAWVVYRELTGSHQGATITTMLLFTQPEFLFVTLRSSHEKFTRTLLLLSIFWLCRSVHARQRLGLFATYIGLFYLTTFAVIASNNLLAHSFIFAVLIALALGWALGRWCGVAEDDQPLLQRLPYAVLICLGLVYLFTFYVYRPAQHDLEILQSAWERVAALFLDVQRRPTNAYAQVSAGWISLPVYFLVSAANWIMLLASLALWARTGFHWLRRRPPATEAARLLWLLYTAFAVQGALSVISDASGSLSSNLQHRIFPSFSMIAVALVGAALARWRPRRAVVPLRLGLAVGLACLAGLSMLKATNEPLLSNKWTFYNAAELAALRWSDDHLRHAAIWTEYDERLSAAYSTVVGTSANRNRVVGSHLRIPPTDLLLTDVTRLRSTRLARPLPVPPDALRVYDNGSAELYHLRPRTPYQR